MYYQNIIPTVKSTNCHINSVTFQHNDFVRQYLISKINIEQERQCNLKVKSKDENCNGLKCDN